MSLRTVIQVSHPTLQGFLGNHKHLDVLYIVETGSALWGLKDENSDTDFTGVYLPSLEECILGRTMDVIKGDTNPHSVNTPQDVDIKFYSIHHFIKTLARGDSDCVALLSAPQNTIVYRDPRMDVFSQKLRQRFLSENAVSSALGGATNRYMGFVKTGDHKQLYHACRFLYISIQIIETGDVQLPVNEKWAAAFKRVKGGDSEFGVRLYTMLDSRLKKRRHTLPKTSLPLVDATILNFYRA